MQLKKLMLCGMVLTSQILFSDAPTTKPSSESIPSSPTTETKSTLYTFPGFVYQADGEWIGSDYLYNLQSDIGLVLDVFLPENQKIEVNSQKLTELCVKSFTDHKLKPRLNPPAGVSALPFFYMQVMVFPSEEGIVTLCSGSLLEAVTVARIATNQKESALQAITWEKKTMFMSTSETFEDDLKKTVEEIANTFGERWGLFEKMKDRTSKSSSTKPGMHGSAKLKPEPITPKN